MHRDLMRLPARHSRTGLLNVIVETPRGSRNKYRYDEELGLFLLHKRLPAGAAFPFDFGFVPATRAEDGDPLDVVVLADEATMAGCLTTVRLLGVLEAEQTEKGETLRNDRLVGVAETEKIHPEITSLDQVPPREIEQIEHFFVSYNRYEGREFVIVGRGGPKVAWKLVESGMRSYQTSGNHAARSRDA